MLTVMFQPDKLCPWQVFDPLNAVYGDQAAKANLYVHQFQVSLMAMRQTPAESVYRGKECSVDSQDAFRWKWSRPPCSHLEAYARDLYEWGRDQQHNHAVLHVAIAGLAQFGKLLGQTWDLDDTGGYTVLP